MNSLGTPVMRKPFDAKNTHCTDFVMHKSQSSMANTANIIDFFEHKLLKYAAAIQDAQQQLVIYALIKDYRDGHVAVAWKAGLPLYTRVIKGT